MEYCSIGYLRHKVRCNCAELTWTVCAQDPSELHQWISIPAVSAGALSADGQHQSGPMTASLWFWPSRRSGQLVSQREAKPEWRFQTPIAKRKAEAEFLKFQEAEAEAEAISPHSGAVRF